MTAKMRVLIADDHPLMRNALSALFEDEVEASNLRATWGLLRRKKRSSQ